MTLLTSCPCFSGKLFEECCKPFLSGEKTPQNPEQLMRSRFSAYSRKNVAYVLKTWHEITRPILEKLDSGNWIFLKVLSSHFNHEEAHGSVAFVAKHVNKNKLTVLHEESNFKLEKDVWFYLDGEIQKDSVFDIVVEMNSPCPCERGKKFGKCCFRV
jgi:SEC-C motif domain protein